MGPILVVMVWIAFGLLFVGIIVYAFYAERKRREAVQQLAADLGLETTEYRRSRALLYFLSSEKAIESE